MVFLATALFTFGMVASAVANQCGDRLATARAAAAKLDRYTEQPDGTTSKALTLARDLRAAVAAAAEACKGTEQEAGLKFAAANAAGVEKALSDAKTERLRDTGIFAPPHETLTSRCADAGRTAERRTRAGGNVNRGRGRGELIPGYAIPPCSRVCGR